MTLFKEAADLGYGPAQGHYASCLEHGSGCRKDVPAALRLYRLAADWGVPMAQYQFALMVDDGSNPDPALAVRYFKLAADQGFASPMRSFVTPRGSAGASAFNATYGRACGITNLPPSRGTWRRSLSTGLRAYTGYS